jgi:hypothetical protein
VELHIAGGLNLRLVERPVHTATLALLLGALAVFATSHLFSSSRFEANQQGDNQAYSAVPLDDLDDHGRRSPDATEYSPEVLNPPPKQNTRRRLVWVIIVILSIVGRIETLRGIFREVECSQRGVEVSGYIFLVAFIP